MNKKIILRCVFWSLTLSVMLLVFLNSAKNATASSELSNSLTDKIFAIFMPDYDDMDASQKFSLIYNVRFFVRKSAHFLSYFAMGMFCFLAVNTHEIKLKNKYIIASSICILYAISDEIHQLFVEGRSGEIRDVFIDSSGVLLAVSATATIVYLCKKRREKRYEKQSENQ